MKIERRKILLACHWWFEIKKRQALQVQPKWFTKSTSKGYIIDINSGSLKVQKTWLVLDLVSWMRSLLAAILLPGTVAAVFTAGAEIPLPLFLEEQWGWMDEW